MILSRTPLRVSFVGGGTDLPAFYENNEYGSVVSMAINRYIYIGVNHRFDGKIRLAYSTNELVDTISEIENDRIQAALRKLEIEKGIEIFYISDVPKKMGLGGSSSFTVGLLNALYQFKGVKAFPERLAREACELEIDILQNSIGKQDQYAAAFGGLNYIRFHANGIVSVRPVMINEELVLSLLNNLFFIYLGQSHDASSILSDVTGNMSNTNSYLRDMRDLADGLYDSMMKCDLDGFTYALRQNWELKKKTSRHISNGLIDDVYQRAMKAGAEAGKVLGAGGGGFFMAYVPPERQASFSKELSDMKIFQFHLDHIGTQVVHNDSGM